MTASSLLCKTADVVPEPVECERVQLRAMTSEMGALRRANGSARVVQGQTAVLCAVYGPAEVKASRELYDRCIIHCFGIHQLINVRVVLPQGSGRGDGVTREWSLGSQGAAAGAAGHQLL